MAVSDVEEAFSPETVEAIDSVDGLRTALEILGHANRAAHEEGNCVMEFVKTESGSVNIQDITRHVEVLEQISDLLDEEDEDNE